MADDKDTEIKITVDAEGAVESIEAVDAALKDVAGTAEETGKATEETEESIESLGTGFSKTQATIITFQSALSLAKDALGLISGAATAAFDALLQAESLEGVNNAFETLQRSVGDFSGQTLEQLRQATQGAVSDMQLVQIANEAVLRGVDDGSGKFEELASAAVKLAQTMGVDAASAVDLLTSGISRGSAEMLRKIGITADLDGALRAFAESTGRTVEELTDEEKQLVITNTVYSEAISQAGELAAAKDSAGQAASRLSATIENLKNQFLLGLSGSEDLTEGVSGLGAALDGIDARQLGEDLATVAAVIANTFTAAVGAAAASINFLKQQFDSIKGLVGGVASPNMVPAGFTGEAITPEKTGLSGQTQAEIAEDAKLLGDLNKELAEQPKLTSTAQAAMNKYGESLKKAQGDIKAILGGEGYDGMKAAIEEILDAQEREGLSIEETSKRLTDLQKIYGATDDVLNTIAQTTKEVSEERTRAIEEQMREEERLFDQIEADSARADKALETLTEGQKEYLAVLVQTGMALDAAFSKAAGANEMLTSMFGAAGGQAGDIMGQMAGGSSVMNMIFPGFDAAADTVMAIWDQVEEIGSSTEKTIEAFYKIGFGDKLGGKISKVVLQGFFPEDAETSARKGVRDFINEVMEMFNEEFEFAFGADVGQFEEGGPLGQFFLGMEETAQEAFNGIGIGLNELLGTGETIANQIAQELASQMGGSLNDLQILVMQLGFSAEQMGDAVVNAFLHGNLSALEAQSALEGIQAIAEKGIPGALGATNQAFQNLIDSAATGIRSVDALSDLGAEALEKGQTSLAQLKEDLVASGQFSAEEVEKLFAAIAAAGVTTLEGLRDISEQTAIALLANLQANNFDFAEAASKVDEVLEKLERLPERVESTVVLNVQSNFDSKATQQVFEQVTAEGPGIA